MESQSRHENENGNASGSRRAKKRRLAEADAAEPAAKRRRETDTGEGGSEESEVERSSGMKNENTQDGTREKEKKKRRKKKKKVPVVQQPHQQDGSPAKQKMSSSSRTTAPSATLKPNGKQKDKKRKQKEKEPTPGPSRLARSRSRSSSPGRDGGEDVDEDEGAGQENGLVTLDSTAPSLKGKERASSPSPHSHSHSTATEVETLTNKLDTITQTIFPSLICNICLYLMHRPFLLSPCGHVACLDCLVSWFSREVPGQGQLMPQVEEQAQQGQNQDEQQNQPEQNQQEQNQPDLRPGPIYDAAGEVFDWVIPPPPIAIPPPPQIPLAIPPPPLAIPPPPLAIPPPPLAIPPPPLAIPPPPLAIPPPPLAIPPPPLAIPPAPAPRPLAKRKKTCPQCRARITTRPVEVWFAKDMVASIVRARVVDLDAVPPSLRPGAPPLNINGEPEADPWKDIFPNKSREGRRTRERELLREMREREWMGDRDDADGGVYRCIDCMTEIWEGVCAECGRVYRGHLPGGGLSDFSNDFSDDGEGSDGEGSEDEGEGDTDDDLGFMLGLHPNLRYLSESGSEGEGGDGFYGMPVQVTWTDDEMEPSDASGSSEGSEGYESSFIDDDGEGERQGEGGREVVELVGSSDDEGEGEREREEDAPRRRAGRIGRRSNPYVISSGEDESESDGGGASPPPRRLGRRDGGVIEVLSDEDEDEGSDNGGGDLAAEVAERERELYGDDGSVPSGRLRSRRGEEDGWDSELSDEVVEDGGVDYMDDDDDEL